MDETEQTTQYESSTTIPMDLETCSASNVQDDASVDEALATTQSDAFIAEGVDETDDEDQMMMEPDPIIVARQDGHVGELGTEEESTDSPSPIPIEEDFVIKSVRPINRLSTISKLYDRGGKEYLDSTEFKLRKMDGKNQGFLDVGKIYILMQEFQKEQKKSLNLKRAGTALSVFTVLLALANIGTSFGAAKLAKDTVVNPATGEMMVKGSGVRVGILRE